MGSTFSPVWVKPVRPTQGRTGNRAISRVNSATPLSRNGQVLPPQPECPLVGKQALKKLASTFKLRSYATGKKPQIFQTAAHLSKGSYFLRQFYTLFYLTGFQSTRIYFIYNAYMCKKPS